MLEFGNAVPRTSEVRYMVGAGTKGVMRNSVLLQVTAADVLTVPTRPALKDLQRPAGDTEKDDHVEMYVCINIIKS